MTDWSDKRTVEELLELYCDDQLSASDRAEFERVIAEDSSLHAQVELQKKLDTLLLYGFGESNAPSEVHPPAPRGSRIWRVAAALLFALSVGVVYWQYGGEPDEASSTIQARTMQGYYDEAIARGFEPGWACTGEQFASTFESRFGERLVVADLPDGVKLSGLGYARILSMQTVSVFATVDAAPVLLFVESRSATGELSSMQEGVYRHLRELGGLLIYEVSRFAAPRILPHLSLSDVQ